MDDQLLKRSILLESLDCRRTEDIFGEASVRREELATRIGGGNNRSKLTQAKEALRAGGPLRRSSLFANHLHS